MRREQTAPTEPVPTEPHSASDLLPKGALASTRESAADSTGWQGQWLGHSPRHQADGPIPVREIDRSESSCNRPDGPFGQSGVRLRSSVPVRDRKSSIIDPGLPLKSGGPWGGRLWKIWSQPWIGGLGGMSRRFAWVAAQISWPSLRATRPTLRCWAMSCPPALTLVTRSPN